MVIVVVSEKHPKHMYVFDIEWNKRREKVYYVETHCNGYHISLPIDPLYLMVNNEYYRAITLTNGIPFRRIPT